MKSFVDMALTPKEQTEKATEMMAASKPSAQKYPYGLCFYLGEDELEKLGVDEVPKAGALIHLMAMAQVTCVTDRDDQNGKEKRLELQITHLALEDEDREDPEEMAERRSKKLYGSDDEGEEA